MKTEVIAGITNYFTVIYLVFLVPELLMEIFPEAVGENGALIQDAILENGIMAGELLVALTIVSFLAAGVGSILMGLAVNIPFIQGPSLTIAAFIVYTVCKGFGYTYSQALAIVCISGICFFIMSWVGLERKIHESIPKNLEYAVTVGIGLFIAFTGISKAHIIENGTVFNLIDFSSYGTKSAYLALAGVIFIAVLLKRKIHGAVFIGKIVCIIAAIPLGLISFNSAMTYNIKLGNDILIPDFANIIDFSSVGEMFKSVSALAMILLSICIMDIFETMGMLIGAKRFISPENDIHKKMPRILEIDALTTALGSTLGITSVSTYAESTTGIVEGGRTGLTAVITGMLLIFSVPAVPFVALMPSAATATTLIVAGVIMVETIKYIDFKDEAEAVPAFFTIIMMPVANSMIFGIAFGMISYLLINIFIGNFKKIKPAFAFISIMLAAMLAVSSVS